MALTHGEPLAHALTRATRERDPRIAVPLVVLPVDEAAQVEPVRVSPVQLVVVHGSDRDLHDGTLWNEHGRLDRRLALTRWHGRGGDGGVSSGDLGDDEHGRVQAHRLLDRGHRECEPAEVLECRRGPIEHAQCLLEEGLLLVRVEREKREHERNRVARRLQARIG